MGEKRRVTGGWHLTMSSTRLSMRMSTFEKEAHSPREQLTASRCRVGGGRIGWREGAVREFGVEKYPLGLLILFTEPIISLLSLCVHCSLNPW